MTLKDLQPQIDDALDGFLEELRPDEIRLREFIHLLLIITKTVTVPLTALSNPNLNLHITSPKNPSVVASLATATGNLSAVCVSQKADNTLDIQCISVTTFPRQRSAIWYDLTE